MDTRRKHDKSDSSFDKFMPLSDWSHSLKRISTSHITQRQRVRNQVTHVLYILVQGVGDLCNLEAGQWKVQKVQPKTVCVYNRTKDSSWPASRKFDQPNCLQSTKGLQLACY